MAGLESGTYISDLNSSNPAGSDGKSQGDDHLRLIKSLILASFPDVDQAVTTIISKATAPSLAQPGTIWFNTAANNLQIRNKADDAWITLAISVVTSNSVDIDAGTIDGVTITGGTINSTPIEGGTIGNTTPITALDVDNININGNTISSTDTNGNIVLDPDGTGDTSITSGDLTITAGNLTLSSGNIVVSGNVDGFDVSVMGDKLALIEASADVTDAANIAAAGAIIDADFNAQTILLAVADNTPTPLTISASRFVGRKASGDAGIMTVAEAKTLLSYGNLAALNTVSATEIDSNAVTQAELKTTNGDISVSATSSTVEAYVTLPGGGHGFWPRLRRTNNGGDLPIHALIFDDVVDSSPVTTSNVAWMHLKVTGGGSGATLYANQEYVQASPPYYLGAIEIPTFIFAMMDDVSGKILAMYQSSDPPWANNGPTIIRPDRFDKATGKSFKTVRTRKSLDRVNDPDFWDDVEVEITADYKNSDMGLIPHPFIGNNLTGRTVVMIDPRMKLVQRLHEMIEVGESPLSLFSDGDVRVGNNDIPAVTRPDGVMVVNATLR